MPASVRGAEPCTYTLARPRCASVAPVADRELPRLNLTLASCIEHERSSFTPRPSAENSSPTHLVVHQESAATRYFWLCAGFHYAAALRISAELAVLASLIGFSFGAVRIYLDCYEDKRRFSSWCNSCRIVPLGDRPPLDTTRDFICTNPSSCPSMVRKKSTNSPVCQEL